MKPIKIIMLFALCISVFVSCDTNSSTSVSPVSSGTGTGGSLARFTLTDTYLYTVDSRTLRVFDLSSGKAVFLTSVAIGFNIETIFARGNTLFLGASDGVHIYDITKRTEPKFLSLFTHIVSCDPVVADANFAYSTLSSGRPRCNRGLNVLDIIDINNLKAPFKVSSLPLTSPQGLGLTSANRLVVCDNGVKLLDITDRTNPKILDAVTSERAFDIIPLGGSFTAVVPGGLTNFTILNDSLRIIGKILYK